MIISKDGSIEFDPECPPVVLGEIRHIDRTNDIETASSKTQEGLLIGFSIFIVVAVCFCVTRKNTLKHKEKQKLKHKFYY
jgi:hypothetical protein